MKSILILLLFLPFSLFSQERIEKGRAVYLFSHIRDTTKPNDLYKEEMMLDFSSNASVYKSYILYKGDSTDYAQALKGIMPAAEFKIPKATFDQHFFGFDKEEYYFIKPWIQDTLVIQEPIDKIQWSIRGQQKKIAGLDCTLARGEYKGRLYQAWFCSDIPVKAGPWKLTGLPGLILEAEDTSGSVHFELQRLQNLDVSSYIGLPRNKRFITKKEWTQMVTAIKENPQGFINAQMSPSGPNQNTTLKVDNSKSSTTSGTKSKTRINNPVELTD